MQAQMTANNNSIYDVCMITMSFLRHDARTINISKTLFKNNKKVCVIGYGNDNEKYDFIDFKTISKPFYSRVFKEWSYFRKVCKKLYPVIQAKTYWASDFYSLPIASHYAKKYGAKLIYDAREIYSAIGSLHNRRFTQTVQTFLEKKWVKNVDKIVVTGELDKEYLINHFKTDIPFYIVKNFPPFREAVKSEIIREKFKIPQDKKILIYQGMISEGRGIIPAIKALSHLEDFVFCIFGDGILRKEAMQLSEKLGLTNKVIFAGNINYSELHQWTCSADIGLALIEPISYSYNLALPNKLFEYCMAGIPSLVSDLPAMKQIIDEFGIGLAINPDSEPKDIAGAISKIAQKDNYTKFKNACANASYRLSFDSQDNIVMSLFNEY
ncbi:glycosyltransferase [Bacteroidetes/Chlorobi group bacterium ChocPot_Mid]|nr:MAG: glycosyltransferase [Bacteroidetes/Chlorobi group bacterium ChocPot_Mid]